MTTVIIEENSAQARRFVEFARTLPFATVVEAEAQKKSFRKASAECGAVSVDAFFDELDERIRKRTHA